MNWTEMSSEEKDRLVAEKIMDWQEAECESNLIEIDGGWECAACGLSGDWGDDFDRFPAHVALPPRYTQSLDAAWHVVRKMNEPNPDQEYAYEQYARFIDALEEIVGSNMFFDLFYCDKDEDHLTSERICKAALEACGIKIERE